MKTHHFLLLLFPFVVLFAANFQKDLLAATRTITASIAFDSLLSLADKTDINFGSVLANQKATYTISPTGNITASDNGLWLGGNLSAGSVTIVGSTTQTVDIEVNNYVTKNGVTPSEATCIYDNGAPLPCALSSQSAPGKGKLLLFGVTVSVDGTQAIGSIAAPSFDVVINYH